MKKNSKQRKRTGKASTANTTKSSTTPVARPRVTRNPDRTFRMHHRELLASLDSASSYVFPLIPSTSLTFPWLSGLAVNFDWYKPNSLSFLYVPSCSYVQASGSLTMAIDYDCSDTPAGSRPELASYGGSVTTQVYKECRIAANSECLQLFKHRYTHEAITTGDPRLASMGNLEVILDASTSPITAGDLFVEYDFTFGAPQWPETVALLTNAVTSVTGPAGDLQMFSPEVEQAVLASTYPEGVTLSKVLREGVHLLYVGFEKVGKYLLTLNETPRLIPDPLPPFVQTYDQPVMYPLGPAGAVELQAPSGQVRSLARDDGKFSSNWAEGALTVTKTITQWLIDVKIIGQNNRYLVALFDQTRQYLHSQGSIVTTVATAIATGLSIQYLGRNRIDFVPGDPFSPDCGALSEAISRLKQKPSSITPAENSTGISIAELDRVTKPSLPTTTTSQSRPFSTKLGTKL